MTMLSRRALLGSALALSTLATPLRASGKSPVERHGRLRVQGNRIVGDHGRPVQLGGMSLFWSQWMGQFYNADAVRWLRDDWNISVVRAAMAVHQGGYMTNPSRERAKVEAVIEAAVELGVYVIVDWHAHQPEPEAAADFFASIATRYGGHPNIIYEPYNEPLPEHGWKTVLMPYHQAVAARIRAADPDNLIVAGTRSWSQEVDEAAADPLGDANTAYTLHFYAGSHGQHLRDKAQKALDRGVALFVTEWGTSEATGDDRLAWNESREWLDFLNERSISHANWSIADKDETSAALLPGAAAKGGWKDEALSPSGRLVREMLRRRSAIG
ncbi:glycoside hydrolase family 5 protein [Sphingomonas gilva]|nr:glycoside hydrolase family 5 protein [Sphingomonas gilva]